MKSLCVAGLAMACASTMAQSSVTLSGAKDAASCNCDADSYAHLDAPTNEADMEDLLPAGFTNKWLMELGVTTV
jgi:hypothetical protein